jgi:NhaP-type Na+/H+ and K+/H+ antiporter
MSGDDVLPGLGLVLVLAVAAQLVARLTRLPAVAPADVEAVLPEALALVAVMALVIRPVAVALATWRSSLSLRERGFIAWMAPRGIVAGASASAFGLQLEQQGVAGADLVLPVVFVAIFATVVLYGLATTSTHSPPRSCASSWATITCSGWRPTRTRRSWSRPPTRTGCC